MSELNESEDKQREAFLAGWKARSDMWKHGRITTANHEYDRWIAGIPIWSNEMPFNLNSK